LAGENDFERAKATGDGREINRRNYTLEEIEQALEKEAVKRLLRLIRFRNEYEAFQGDFEALESADDEIRLRWTRGDAACTLHVDLRTNRAHISYLDADGQDVHFRV
jgi:sucrose phosphorylase